jgi:threonine dehydrogenase-like Zn-dependent dehydrogenase
MELLEQKRMDFAPVISHRFPARRMLEAYHIAARHTKEFTAAVFDWTEFHHAG